jgi:hypothetical protein
MAYEKETVLHFGNFVFLGFPSIEFGDLYTLSASFKLPPERRGEVFLLRWFAQTPPNLKVFEVKVKPADSFLSLGTEEISSEYGRCWITWICLVTMQLVMLRGPSPCGRNSVPPLCSVLCQQHR